MHSGGALERSRLYTTAATQARKLRQRAQQLTDILDLGSLSAADVPLSTLLPHIAAGIARSLGFATVQIGEILTPTSARRAARLDGPGLARPAGDAVAGRSASTCSPPAGGGRPPALRFQRGLSGRGQPGSIAAPSRRRRLAPPSRRLILLPLESSGGGTLGYLLAAPAAGWASPSRRWTMNYSKC